MKISSKEIWKGIRQDNLAAVAKYRLPAVLIAVSLMAFIFIFNGTSKHGLEATLHLFWIIFWLTLPIFFAFFTDFDFAEGFFVFKNCGVIRFQKLSLHIFLAYLPPFLPVPTSPPRQPGRALVRSGVALNTA
jgi:ABC-type uncharacterized transport system permease subunit